MFVFSGLEVEAAAWSPDGRVIACGAGNDKIGSLRDTIIVVRVEDTIVLITDSR